MSFRKLPVPRRKRKSEPRRLVRKGHKKPVKRLRR